MHRAALLALLTTLSVVTAAGVVTGQTAQVSVADVTVTPDQPAPGERFTVTTVVRNGASQPDARSVPFEINTLLLRRAGDDRAVARVDDLGVLPPGSTMRVPLTHVFETAGVKDLRVVVVGETDGNVQTLRYPVVVTVRQGGPQVTVESSDEVVGAETTVDVAVSNGESTPVRNVRVALSASGGTVDDGARVAPTMAAGATQTFEFAYTPTAAESEVTATVGYTTDAGDRRTVAETHLVTADPLSEDVSVDASVDSEAASPPVAVEVANFGNAPLTDVVVRAEADGTVVGRRSLADVPAETTREARVNVSSVEAADLRVVADYETGGRAGSAATTVAYEPAPGRIRLTGVDYEYEGDRVHLTGSASNVGLSDADGVLLRVLPAEGVEPARPYREYFVGTVPASDFVSFDLYARLSGGSGEIPVEVSYLVDGERRTTVERVDVSDLQSPASRQSSGGGGLLDGSSLWLLAGGVVAAVVVAAVAVVAYRRR
jgi:hypothetical protein